VLVAEPGEVAAERLKVFRDTNDGFEIARADLRIRGQGDLFGAQQHGRELLLRHADLMRDERLLVHAQRLARAMVEADPELRDERHARARAVLEARWSERLEMFAVG
jgi:ATP-dependent DNA helicase RecG